MKATFAQYCRIEMAAGGAMVSERALLRQAWKLLSSQGRSHEARIARHEFFRSVLEHNRRARQEDLT